MSYAVVFSGQGAQHANMLPWLEHDELFERTESLLSVADLRAALTDAHWASRNYNAQLLLAGLQLAAWEQLSASLPAPAAVAGCSVGEVAAFCAAGVFGTETALDIACKRARAMDHADTVPSGLMAVMGLSIEQIRSVCRSCDCAVAIRYGSHHVVVGGARRALTEALALFEAHGGRCASLPVALASHTALMRMAADELSRGIAGLPFHLPGVPLFSNTGHRIGSAQTAREALTAQLCSTVCWDACMQSMRERNVRCVLEIGAGGALARTWNEFAPHVPARSCDDFREASAVIGWVKRHVA